MVFTARDPNYENCFDSNDVAGFQASGIVMEMPMIGRSGPVFTSLKRLSLLIILQLPGDFRVMLKII
jgi:hypothetical protein